MKTPKTRFYRKKIPQRRYINDRILRMKPTRATRRKLRDLGITGPEADAVGCMVDFQMKLYKESIPYLLQGHSSYRIPLGPDKRHKRNQHKSRIRIVTPKKGISE